MKGVLAKWIAVLAIAGWAGAANSSIIVGFTSVGGARVAADNEAPGVTGFSLGRSTGLVQNAADTFDSRDWFVGGSKLNALVANDALFWGFNSSLGYDLTSISFGYDRSSTGPSSIALDLFVNGASQGEIFSDMSVADDSTGSATIDLSAFDNVTNGFFRLTGWNATDATGTFDIENRAALGGRGIVVRGELVSVPVPATLALLGIGLAGLGWSRRKKS